MLLRNKFLAKVKYFHGTGKEWTDFIRGIKKSTRKEVVVCDPYPNSSNKDYPEDIKIIKSVNTARRTLFLTDSIVFLYTQDKWTRTKVNSYLNSNSSIFYYFLTKQEVLEKIIKEGIHIRVKIDGGYIK